MQVYSWGCNDQKAIGRSGDEYLPAPILELASEHVVKVVAGDSSSFALTNDGRVYGWGTFRDSTGIIGFSPSVQIQEQPVVLTTLSGLGVIDLACGSNHVLALTANGNVFSWGSGEQGQLGRRILTRNRLSLAPARVLSGPRKAVRIYAGNYSSFVVLEDGQVLALGLNNYGQLGTRSDEETIWQFTSTVVSNVDMIAAGEHHSLFLKKGSISSVGRNNFGQLGNGQTIDSKTLVEPSLKNVTQIASGDYHCLALTGAGEVHSWGYGELGQLGTGEEDKPLPTKVQGKALEGRKVYAIEAGGQHSLFLVSPLPRSA